MDQKFTDCWPKTQVGSLQDTIHIQWSRLNGQNITCYYWNGATKNTHLLLRHQDKSRDCEDVSVQAVHLQGKAPYFVVDNQCLHLCSKLLQIARHNLTSDSHPHSHSLGTTWRSGVDISSNASVLQHNKQGACTWVNAATFSHLKGGAVYCVALKLLEVDP